MKMTPATTAQPRDKESARRLAHFNATNAIYHPEIYLPNTDIIQHVIVRKMHHLGQGVYQAYYAIRGIRRADNVQIFECDVTPIHWDDGTISIYWTRKNGNRFVMDNVQLPA